MFTRYAGIFRFCKFAHALDLSFAVFNTASVRAAGCSALMVVRDTCKNSEAETRPT